MEQIYYGIAIAVYAIFIIRFILSWIGGDFELDTDLDISDVVSFKGLTHFLMGVSGWLSVKSVVTHNVVWYDYLIAFALGVIFVMILYFVYKSLIKLECKPTILFGNNLIGKVGKVYLSMGIDSDNMYKYIITVDNGVGTTELPAKSTDVKKTGDSVTIKQYVNAYYII